jgi:hypothetical protein
LITGDEMPVNSRDIQYGAAAGFVIIVGIVAIQFGFSAKLVLALLAGVGVLFCASLFDGLPRAAMLGAGAVMLLLVVYDLATSCDSVCQQTRAQAAQQRTAQEQARLAASRPQVNPHCMWSNRLVTVGATHVALDPDNPDAIVCRAHLHFKSNGERCYYIWVVGESKERDTKYCDRDGVVTALPDDVKSIRSASGPLLVQVTLEPPPQ